MRLSLHLLLLFFAGNILAQRQLAYPVKVNHKWGFMTADSELVVEPKYDAIATRPLGWMGDGSEKDNSGFRLVQVGDRLGLLDSNLVEVLEPNYLRIRPLSPQLFAVVLPPQPSSTITHQLFTIVNRKGERTVEGNFEDVHLFSGATGNACQFVKVKRGEKWGVFSSESKEILPTVYAAIEFFEVGEGFFKVKTAPTDTLWSLLDSHRKTILPQKFLEIQAISPNFFAAKPPRKNWGAWDADGKPLLLPVWQAMRALNRHLACVQDAEGRWRIYSHEKQDTVSFDKKFNGFAALGKDYVVAYSQPNFSSRRDSLGGRSVVLLDSSAREVKTPIFRDIRPLQDSLYLGLKGAWGIFTLKKGIVLPCIYDSIGQFENGMAFIFRNEMSGILGQNMKVWVPPMLEAATRQDSIFKGWDGDNKLKVYRIDPVDTLLFLQDAENVRQIRVRKGAAEYVEARIKQPELRTTSNWLFSQASSFWQKITGTNYNWEIDPATSRFGLQKFSAATNGWQFVESGYAKLTLDLSEARLTLVYDTTGVAVQKTAFVTVLPQVRKMYPFALFSHQSGKVVCPPQLLALRARDFKRRLPFAAFFDLDGRMGLINRQGEQAQGKDDKPLRFSYIGEFAEGKARVCLGGEFAFTSEAKEEKFGVIKTGELLREFGLLIEPDDAKIPDTLLQLESPEGEKIRWGFIDTLGNVVIEPVYDFVQNFQNDEAVAQKNKLWGVMNPQGKPLLEFRYVSLQRFFGNWKVSEKSINTLFFDEKGRQISEAKYRRQGSFSEGFCRVQRVAASQAATSPATPASANAPSKTDTLWGFINRAGVEAIACRFELARDFSEGLAAVKSGGKWGFIDTTGNFPFDLEAAAGGEVSGVGDFHAGRAWFKTGGTKGYLDRNGKVRIEAKFVNAFDFQTIDPITVNTSSANSTAAAPAAVARVVYLKKTGLIDTAGNFILEPKQFERISEFNAWGVAEAWVKFSDKKSCLINSQGNALTPVKYVKMGEFREGFAMVSIGTKQGLLNRHGVEVLPLEFTEVSDVCEGLVAVRVPHQPGWQFYDTLNRLAFKGNFDKVLLPFNKGFATVIVNENDPTSKLVLDRQGKKAPFPAGSDFHSCSEGIFGFWQHQSVLEGGQKLHYYYADAQARNLFGQYFQEIEPFSGGVALVKKKHRWGLVNQFGLPVIEPKYPFAPKQEAGSMVVNLGVALGILDRSGKPLIPPGYDRIEWMEGNVFRVELGEKIGYANEDGGWIWELRK